MGGYIMYTYIWRVLYNAGPGTPATPIRPLKVGTPLSLMTFTPSIPIWEWRMEMVSGKGRIFTCNTLCRCRRRCPVGASWPPDQSEECASSRAICTVCWCACLGNFRKAKGLLLGNFPTMRTRPFFPVCSVVLSVCWPLLLGLMMMLHLITK